MAADHSEIDPAGPAVANGRAADEAACLEELEHRHRETGSQAAGGRKFSKEIW